jgi:hypothetical protein
MSSAVGMLEAHAQFNSPLREVFIRVGAMDGKMYIDLCNCEWQVVEIDSEGWQIIVDPPVRFRRTKGMQPLPVPKLGGAIGTLKQYLNVASDDDFILTVSWLLAALRNTGPFPILALAGEHGTAKSTFSAILRQLCDLNSAPLRTMPRDDRDLFIAANNSHILAFDNVSSVAPWISDTLCRLATGGGFATRTLHTDDDETLFNATRPIILNGIEDMVKRSDLASRSIFITLEPMPECERRAEREFYDAFNKDCPKIFGTLLTALSAGLGCRPKTKLTYLPRMADFAPWASACEPTLWNAGSFQAAYFANIGKATETVIEADIIGCAVRDFMAGRPCGQYRRWRRISRSNR